MVLMIRVSCDFGNMMQQEAVTSVSTDVGFISGHFPDYKIGANDQVVQAEQDEEVLSMNEIVVQETAQLLEQEKRLSVRDLAHKFEKGLAASAKLSSEAKFREAVFWDRHVLLKRLSDVLEQLKRRVAGRNQDDVEEATSMVEALAVQLTQREGELLEEKSEMRRLANLLKQAIIDKFKAHLMNTVHLLHCINKASEDAKKVVEEERASARAEIEKAKVAVWRVEQAFQERQQISKNSKKEDQEELMMEVQDARRIKMLHQPSKVMDMEHELQALRTQFAEMSRCSLQLQKELAMCKRLEENTSHFYELDGFEALGSILRIIPCIEDAPDISKFSIQWYRIASEGGKKELISGATKSVYAPEPFDVGRLLQAEIVSDEQRFVVTTTGPVDPAAGLGGFVEALVRKTDTEFNVVVTHVNGHIHPSQSVHVFHVGKMRIKLRKGKSTMAKEPYSTSMQLCGVRGGGNAAAQALFWQPKKGLFFTLAFESERERNAAIMLARRFAFDCNVMLAGPDDRAPLGTQ